MTALPPPRLRPPPPQSTDPGVGALGWAVGLGVLGAGVLAVSSFLKKQPPLLSHETLVKVWGSDPIVEARREYHHALQEVHEGTQVLLAATSDTSANEGTGAGTGPSGGSRYGNAAVLITSVGWRYWYGGYPGVDTWEEGHLGVDCSLYCSLCLVQLANLPNRAGLSPGARKTFKRYTAATLAEACDPVPWGDQLPGDIAIYPGHVAMVMTKAGDVNIPQLRDSYHPPGEDSQVIGASGGHAYTFGNDPKASVKVFDSALYRGTYDAKTTPTGFITFGRLKPIERVGMITPGEVTAAKGLAQATLGGKPGVTRIETGTAREGVPAIVVVGSVTASITGISSLAGVPVLYRPA